MFALTVRKIASATSISVTPRRSPIGCMARRDASASIFISPPRK
jgi:hypothetical protein